MDKNFTFVGSQELKANLNSEHHELVRYLDDLHHDYQLHLCNFVKHGAFGYRLQSGEELVDVTASQCAEDRRLYAGSEDLSAAYLRYIEVLAGKDQVKDVNSGYGLFYSDYTPNDRVRSDHRRALDTKSVLVNQEPVEGFAEVAEAIGDDLPQVRDRFAPQLVHIRALMRETSEESRRECKSIWAGMWSELCILYPALGARGSFTADIVSLRNGNVSPPCRKPRSYAYCTALYHMLRSRLSGWYECLCNKTDERASERNSVEVFRTTHPELFESMIQFLTNLRQKDYGLRRFYLLKNAIRKVRRRRPGGDLGVVESELVAGNYQQMMNANEKLLAQCFYRCLTHFKLENSSEYIRIPGADSIKHYPVPCGQTGRGHSFELSLDRNRLLVKIEGFAQFTCKYSNYFHFTKIEKSSTGYDIYFRHRLKNVRRRRGKTYSVGESKFSAEEFCGKVNQIDLRVNGTDVFARMAYTLDYGPEKQALKNFLNSADGVKSRKWASLLGDRYNTGSVDLGINKQTFTAAEIFKGDGDGQGEFKVLDYGHGNFLCSPQAFCQTGEIGDQAKEIGRVIRSVTNIIREVKSSRKTNTPLPVDFREQLAKLSGHEVADNQGLYRFQVQTALVNASKKLKALKYELRKGGNNELGDSLAVLAAWKAMDSLTKSYMNFHVKEGDRGVYWKKSDQKLVNFRRAVSKKVAAVVVSFAKRYKCDVFFVEDLTLATSVDNTSRMNSLISLFAPGQLKTDIESSLTKHGIVCCFVNPNHTSRTGPGSGNMVYRPGRREEGLPDETRFALRQHYDNVFSINSTGEYVRMDADEVGAANILLTGLNHSVFQTSVWINARGKIETTSVSNGEDGVEGAATKQRVLRFVEEEGLRNAYFVERTGSVEPVRVRPQNHLMNVKLYHDASGFYTEAQWWAKEDIIRQEVIRHLGDVEGHFRKIDVTPESDGAYHAFQVEGA
jgi:IS605 OrfB family transposase